MTETRVQLPANGWRPRPDQMPMWAYLQRGGTRCDVVAHRRWGKDDVTLHWTAVAAHQRIGTYWHMLPEASQARKAIWDAINPRTGKRRIDEAFPKTLRAYTREQEMMIGFKCGSTWQVIGSDNYDSLVGSPPIGVCFSEWGLAKPNAWGYIRPILLENGGWAVFIWTPRGRNHATRAFDARSKDPAWFAMKAPAAVNVGTEEVSEYEMRTPVFTKDQLLQELQELIDESGSVEEGTALFNQEYLVDFDAPTPGSYYGTQIQQLITAGRYGEFPYNSAFKVSTSWDLGIDDYTAVWFWQRIAQDKVNIIDFYETGDVGLDTIVREALLPKLRLNWNFDLHYFPHDVQKRELGAGGRSVRETAIALGVRPIRVGIARDPTERINASRRLLPYCYFNQATTQSGVDHLRQYRKRWNQALGVFGGPLHDNNSHAADAFGEFAVNARLPKTDKNREANKPRSGSWMAKPSIRSMVGNTVRNWKVM